MIHKNLRLPSAPHSQAVLLIYDGAWQHIACHQAMQPILGKPECLPAPTRTLTFPFHTSLSIFHPIHFYHTLISTINILCIQYIELYYFCSRNFVQHSKSPNVQTPTYIPIDFIQLISIIC